MEELNELKSDLILKVQEFSFAPSINALHDFRVAVRRFLSNTQIDKKSKKSLKEVFRFSSPIRDMDTLILKVEELKPSFDAVKDMLIGINSLEYQKLLALIDELDIKEVIKHCTVETNEQDEQFAIGDEFAHFSKRLLELIKEDSLADKEELHALRKKLKKIRYRFEHTHKLPSLEAVGSFKRLQDALGFINDRHSWQKILYGSEFYTMESVKPLIHLVKEKGDVLEFIKGE